MKVKKSVDDGIRELLSLLLRNARKISEPRKLLVSWDARVWWLLIVGAI
jgi:hypothetical protein